MTAPYRPDNPFVPKRASETEAVRTYRPDNPFAQPTARATPERPARAAAPVDEPGVLTRAGRALVEMVRNPGATAQAALGAVVADPVRALLTPVEGERPSSVTLAGGKGGAYPGRGLPAGSTIDAEGNTVVGAYTRETGGITEAEQRAAQAGILGGVIAGPVAGVAGRLIGRPLGRVVGGAIAGAAQNPDDPGVGAVLGGGFVGGGEVVARGGRAAARVASDVADPFGDAIAQAAADVAEEARVAQPTAYRRRPADRLARGAPVETRYRGGTVTAAPAAQPAASSAGVLPAPEDALPVVRRRPAGEPVRTIQPRAYRPDNPFLPPDLADTTPLARGETPVGTRYLGGTVSAAPEVLPIDSPVEPLGPAVRRRPKAEEPVSSGPTIGREDTRMTEPAREQRPTIDVQGYALPLNADGTVTLYHGTTAAGAEGIRASGVLRSAGEPDVYFTTDPTGAGYGDGTVVAVRVDPRLLHLDDEFPGGRIDFRARAGAGRSFRVHVEQVLTPTRTDIPSPSAGRAGGADDANPPPDTPSPVAGDSQADAAARVAAKRAARLAAQAAAPTTPEPPRGPPVRVESVDGTASVAPAPPDIAPVVSANGEFTARPGVLRRVTRELDARPDEAPFTAAALPDPTDADRAVASAEPAAPTPRTRLEFRAQSTPDLMETLKTEQQRLEREANDPSRGGWTRQTDDGGVVSGNTFRGGRMAQAAKLTARRIEEIERELIRRGVPESEIMDARASARERAFEGFGADDDASFDFGANLADNVAQLSGETPRPDVPEPPTAPRSERAERLPPASEQPGGINWRTWGDRANPTSQRIVARVQQRAAELQASGALDVERVPLADQQRLADATAKELLANPLEIDRLKLRKLAAAEIVALKTVVQEQTSVLEAASRALDSGSLSAHETAQALRVVDEATRATDEALSLIRRESAEKGRELGALRLLARQSVDPAVWIIQAKKLAGGKPVPDRVMIEIRRLAREAADACGGGS